MIEFLAIRAVRGVESVTDGVYYRTVKVKKGKKVFKGWISVANTPNTNSLHIKASPELSPVLTEVLKKIGQLFDINCNPLEVYAKLKVMNLLAPNICVPGMRLPGCFDPFEMSVRAILGQQITVKAARTLAGRLAEAFGDKVDTPINGLGITFPSPDVIYKLKSPVEGHLCHLGVTGARARAIRVLAEAIITGSMTFSIGAEREKEMQKLSRIPGFGPWTMQYVAMRVFGCPDAFPNTDYGVKKVLARKKPQEIIEISQAWKPWRSYAVINLWNSLKKK